MAKVYIGVGHGGADPGAVSGKHREAHYALDIANACTSELKRHGVQVMQSRTSDTTESAAAKIAECNKYSPDLALDIHLNAGCGDGFEVYHSITGGKGKSLALALEKAVKDIGQNSRGVKTRTNSSGRDYFGFIRQTNCPAVLVECAFIDSRDVQAVDTLAERQVMGRALAHGILAYLGTPVKTETGAGCGGTAGGNGTTTPATPTLPESASVLLPVIRRGGDAPGYQIERVQLCLNQMGYTGADGRALTVDGDFGANTEAAVKKLQAAHNIKADGVVTAGTWRALLVFKK